jgi:hypothetical protein
MPLQVTVAQLAAAGGSQVEPQGPAAALEGAGLLLAAGQVPVAAALALAQQQRRQQGGPVAAPSAAAAAAPLVAAAAPARLPLLLSVAMALLLLALRQGQLQALPLALLPPLAAAAPPVAAPQQLAGAQQAQGLLLLGLLLLGLPSGQGAAQTGQPPGPAAGRPHLQGQQPDIHTHAEVLAVAWCVWRIHAVGLQAPSSPQPSRTADVAAACGEEQVVPLPPVGLPHVCASRRSRRQGGGH